MTHNHESRITNLTHSLTISLDAIHKYNQKERKRKRKRESQFTLYIKTTIRRNDHNAIAKNASYYSLHKHAAIHHERNDEPNEAKSETANR